MQWSVHETNTFQFASSAKLAWRTKERRELREKRYAPDHKCKEFKSCSLRSLCSLWLNQIKLLTGGGR
jgi:hypothetical protein